MDKEQFKKYEEALDVQYNLITQLNKLKEKRDKLKTEGKNLDSAQLDKQIFALELEAEILLSKMQENYELIKKLQTQLNTDKK